MGLHRDDSVTPGDTGEGSGGSSELSRELTAATPAPGAGSLGARTSSIAPGTRLDHFDVLELLGAGGFGEVYRARDTRLARDVAVKVLPEDFLEGEENRARFEREAKMLAALNHPNIAAIYSFEEISGSGSSRSSARHLIVMELVEGKTLHAVLANGPLFVEKAIPIALQIIDALAEAHRAGILHRDIKSGNIALTGRGQVKVLDFGVAKLFGPAPEQTDGSTVEKLTAEGASLGTITHMPPEQLLGRAVDQRSDLFSFGVVLYEMVTGRLPFEGSTTIAVADAILHAEPRDFGDMPLPAKLKAIIRKLLEKDPAERYASAEEVHADLKSLEASLAPTRAGGLSRNVKIAVAAAVVGLTALAGWYWHRSSRERWALAQIPEITRLIEADDNLKAVSILEEAKAILPKDAALEKLWLKATGEASLETVPAGADVSIRPYNGDESTWLPLGKTPLKKLRVPSGAYVWRLSKAGFATITYLDSAPTEETFNLPPEDRVPPGMVSVQGYPVQLAYPYRDAPRVRLDDFLIDRTEVTNEEYKKFVEARGYEKHEYWKEPFVRDGRALSWDEAIALFRDSTGRPGPATWQVGSFPKGREKHPVAGVSWYEAAAYAEFAGKSLPTAYHGTAASEFYFAQLIVSGSNFRGEGTQPVGGPGTLSGFGTSDMAGNVKEWCRNESGAGKRFLLGGGFGEPNYMFYQAADAQFPWERRANYGFRCVKLSVPTSPEASAKLDPVFRDFSKEKPVSDELFSVFRRLYAYEKGDLNAKVEETKATADWIWEKVSLNAAYGGERFVTHVFLPKNTPPPFQTVIYFPGANALAIEKFDASFIHDDVEFLPKSGRALVIPIYKSTFERRDEWKSGGKPTVFRDHIILWSKDLGRSLDYLETRKDIDGTRLAYLGFSWGAAPVHLTVDERFRAAILISGGFWQRVFLPESDPFNFVTHVSLPVLLLNDRYDHSFPVEASQLPFYRLLGTPDKDKRRVVYESGHGGLPYRELVRESLDWPDKYLGPVKR